MNNIIFDVIDVIYKTNNNLILKGYFCGKIYVMKCFNNINNYNNELYSLDILKHNNILGYKYIYGKFNYANKIYNNCLIY
jgi:hypothetical protein